MAAKLLFNKVSFVTGNWTPVWTNAKIIHETFNIRSQV